LEVLDSRHDPSYVIPLFAAAPHTPNSLPTAIMSIDISRFVNEPAMRYPLE
jgi:hypothetical protein